MAVWFRFWCSTRLLMSEKKVAHLTRKTVYVVLVTSCKDQVLQTFYINKKPKIQPPPPIPCPQLAQKKKSQKKPNFSLGYLLATITVFSYGKFCFCWPLFFLLKKKANKKLGNYGHGNPPQPQIFCTPFFIKILKTLVFVLLDPSSYRKFLKYVECESR